MTDKTKELREARANVESMVSDLLKEFEDDTGLIVEDVRINRGVRHIGQRAASILSVDFEVIL